MKRFECLRRQVFSLKGAVGFVFQSMRYVFSWRVLKP